MLIGQGWKGGYQTHAGLKAIKNSLTLDPARQTWLQGVRFSAISHEPINDIY